MEHGVDNDLQYICASIRYLQTCVDDTYSRNAWLFHSRKATRSPFLHRVLRLTLGYLLQLLPRHLLLLKIPTFKRINPFCWWQKGERDGVIFGSYLGCFYLSFYLVFIYVLFIRGHVVFGVFGGHVVLHCSSYFVVCNLFWGWHEPLYGQTYFMISLLSLGSYVSLYFVDIWYISSVCGMWYVCVLVCPL